MRKIMSKILYIICITIISSSVITFFAGGCDFYRVNVLGYRLSFVMSESMEPTIMTHALCMTDMIHKDYKVGDVIVYEHEEEGVKLLICHRLKEIREDGTLVAKGDNNQKEDPWEIRQEDVVGKIIGYWNGFSKVYKGI